jgi:hypothetical protein
LHVFKKQTKKKSNTKIITKASNQNHHVQIKTIMGNSAVKQLDETELGVGTLKPNDGKTIASALVTTAQGTTKIKNKSKMWFQYGGGKDSTLLWSVKVKHGGMFKYHYTISDSLGKPVATIIIHKKDSTSITSYVGRSVPSYEGQEQATAEELEKAGLEAGTALYLFAKMEATRTRTTAKCTYGLVKGKDDEIEPLYEAEQLSSLGFRAIFKETTGGIVVAKAYTPGMSMSPHMDVASGVDMLAIASMVS